VAGSCECAIEFSVFVTVIIDLSKSLQYSASLLKLCLDVVLFIVLMKSKQIFCFYLNILLYLFN
jgi:hypothetical protein